MAFNQQIFTPVRQMAGMAVVAANLLVTTLSSQAAPFSQQDWPNPQTPKRVQTQIYVRPGGPAPAAAPFSQTAWNNPQSRRARPLSWSSDGIRTVAASTLPFSQTDWPNPQTPRRAAPPTIYVRPGAPAPAAVAAPFSQTAWNNPQGKRARPLSWSNDGIRAVAPTVAPFAQANWPNPVRKPASLTRSWANTGLREIPISSAPFSQVDWQNPQRGHRPRQDFVRGNLPIGRDQFFGAQGQPPTYDYPNPRGAQSPISLRTHSESLKIQLLRPFFTTEWSNPQRRTDSRQDFIRGMMPPAAQAQAPFFQTDWQNPQTKPRLRQGWIGGSLKEIPLATTVPFAQYNWPTPQVKVFFYELRTWTQSLALLLPAPAQLPPGKAVFPEPRGATSSIELRSWVKPAQVHLIGKDALPFRQRDWQNPGQPRRLTALSWTFPVTHLLPAPLALPPGKYVLPEPRGPRYSQRLGFAATGLREIAIEEPPPPSAYRKIITLHENRIDVILG